MSIMDKFDLGGRVALVTGATRGLGAEFAVALAEAGADIVVHGRDEAAARVTADRVEAVGRKAHIVLRDLSEPGAADAVVDEAEAAAGAIDILINNAGACIHRNAIDVTDEEWGHVMQTNVTALWRMSRAAGKRMLERGSGSIVNIGSISGMIVNRPQMQPAYNASKAAVHQLTKSLAAEWAPAGVRVNAVAPGYIKTDMSPVDEPRFQRYWIEDAPQQRYATPDEVAPAVVFLASDAASFMSGSIIVIDGGYTLF